MDQDILMCHSGGAKEASHAIAADDPLSGLHSRLAIVSGRPSRGVVTAADLVSLSESDIRMALDEIHVAFRAAARQAHMTPDSTMLQRKLSQLALNKLALEREYERRQPHLQAS